MGAPPTPSAASAPPRPMGMGARMLNHFVSHYHIASSPFNSPQF
jgi:hypothetical protein